MANETPDPIWSASDRSQYSAGALDVQSMAANPLIQLAEWIQEAEQSGINEPTAMCLSTAGQDGQPSGRMVLARLIDEESITFFTNYLSRKGTEVEGNPLAAGTFWWPHLERQVRFQGSVQKATSEVSDQYFASRPLESQIASTYSPQSQSISDYEEFTRRYLERLSEVMGPLTRPEHWGGYRIIPKRVEFWQGGAARFHDRLLYTLREDGIWITERLAP